MHEIKQTGDASKIEKLEEIISDAEGWETNDRVGCVIKDIQENNLV